MGASTSQATHTVQLRLDYPESHSSQAFFANLHTAAEGIHKYTAWGKAQTLGLLPDDVITVSIFTARSEDHFDRLQCDPFAEVYLPWDIIEKHMGVGNEAHFMLGLQQGAEWLGQNASPVQYRSAFSSACGMAKDSPMSPKMHIAIHRLPHSSDADGGETGTWPHAASSSKAGLLPASSLAELPLDCNAQDPVELESSAGAASPAVACSLEKLSPKEMKRLFRLQVQNQELRTRLRLRDGDGPDVDEQVRAHLGLLRRAVSENYTLRAQQQLADRELAELNTGLSREQHLAITDSIPGLPPMTHMSSAEDDLEHERRTSIVMSEIQVVTNENVEFITRYDQQIRSMEVELLAARANQPDRSARGNGAMGVSRLAELKHQLQQQIDEFQGLEAQCEKLEVALSEACVGKCDRDSMLAQKLRLEHEVQVEEIGHLRQILERQWAEGPAVPPGSGTLQDQVSALQAEVSEEESRRAEERLSAEQQVDEIRHDARSLQAELEVASEAKIAVEHELAELRAWAHGGTSAIEREQVEEEVRRDSLEKELSRSHCRIRFFDEKVQQLREEAADIRQRASHALQAALVSPGDRAPEGVHAAELGVEVMKVREAWLQAEQAEVQPALDITMILPGTAEAN